MINIKNLTDKNKFSHEKITTEKYQPIPYLIEEMVIQYPDNIAVIENGISYTYKTLWENSITLKNYFIKRGLKPEQVVIIYGHASFNFIINVIAIWLCGCIVVPLDKDVSIDRIGKTIEKADVKAFVHVNDKLVNQIAVENFIDVTDIDSILSYLKIKNVKSYFIQPDDAAYVFSTSGTTGNPKLVLGIHNSLSHFLHWQKTRFSISTTDKCLLTTHVSFDVILRDIFLALISGASLIIPHINYVSPMQLVEKYNITYLHVTPSKLLIWSLIPSEKNELKSLKWIFSAGEPLSFEIISAWRTRGFSGLFVNLYGPTETTLAKCFKVIDVPQKTKIQPVGVPISGTQICIVDQLGNYCKANEQGEIVIKTAYGTYGYINPTRNEEKFFIRTNKNYSFTEYFTGDIGYFDKEGDLHIIGRNNEEIKLHGVKINLVEIESLLKNISKISYVKVLVIETKHGLKKLVAFYMTNDGEQLNDKMLFKCLNKFLPKIALPKQYLHMKVIPITKNGKVSKSALLEYYENHNKNSRKTTTKNILLDIARSFLNHSVTSTCNLFDHGLDSLTTIAFIAEINKRCNVKLQFNSIIENPTVQKLTFFLQNKPSESAINTIILNHNKKNVIFAFPPISGWGIIYKDLADFLTDYTIHAFDFVEDDNCIDTYAKYILDNIPLTEEFYLLGYSAGGNVAYEVSKEIEKLNCARFKLVLLDSPPKTKHNSATEDELYKFADDFFVFLNNIGFVKELSPERELNLITKQIKKRVFHYKKFHNKLINFGKINAEIILITCNGNKEITDNDITVWSEMTQYGLMIYQGIGDHFSMVSKNNVLANAKLLRTIFNHEI